MSSTMLVLQVQASQVDDYLRTDKVTDMVLRPS